MTYKEFQKSFGEIAKSNSYETAFGGWIKESDECIIVLDLQKSNHSASCYLNIKIYIREIFGNNYVKNKNLIKNDTGDVFRRIPPEYGEIFNFENNVQESERIDGLNRLFKQFLEIFIGKALSMTGIIELAGEGQVLLLPAVKTWLEKRISSKLGNVLK